MDTGTVAVVLIFWNWTGCRSWRHDSGIVRACRGDVHTSDELVDESRIWSIASHSLAAQIARSMTCDNPAVIRPVCPESFAPPPRKLNWQRRGIAVFRDNLRRIERQMNECRPRRQPQLLRQVARPIECRIAQIGAGVMRDAGGIPDARGESLPSAVPAGGATPASGLRDSKAAERFRRRRRVAPTIGDLFQLDRRRAWMLAEVNRVIKAGLPNLQPVAYAPRQKSTGYRRVVSATDVGISAVSCFMTSQLAFSGQRSYGSKAVSSTRFIVID